MRRATAVALLLVLAPAAFADLVHDLLALPVPRPGVVMELPDEPPMDAPLDQLAGWWALPQQENEMPSDQVRERLVEVIDKRPDLLPSLIRFFPQRREVCDAVKPAASRDYVAGWMLLNCESERETLAAYSLMAQDDDRGYVTGMEGIATLAHSDPVRAEPVLLQLVASPQPSTRALALTLLYQHTPKDEYQRALKSLASDGSAPEIARGWAIEALAIGKWEGRDEWLLQLMAGGTLPEPHAFLATAAIVGSDEDHWIPVFVKLLDDPDPAKRTVAARALGVVQFASPRADALKPLLPWLSNPDWVDDAGIVRTRIVQSVARLGMTEAIPGLLWILENDRDDTLRSYAAEALAQFNDPHGNDAIRRLIDTVESDDDRRRLIAALTKNGGYTAIELARGLEASVALALQRNEAFDTMLLSSTEEKFSTEVMIGLHVATDATDRDDVARLVIRRAEEIRRDEPRLSEALIDVIETWPVPAANELLVSQLIDGSASATKISRAIESREFIRTSPPPALSRLRAADGAMAGIAAVLIGDTVGERHILAGNDIEAQRGLLAAARLAHDELPAASIADLFGRTPLLDEAAEAFLADAHDAAADSLVRARHPDQLVILGWGGDSEWEEEMMCRFLLSDAAELIAVKRDSYDLETATLLAIDVSARGAASPDSAQDIVSLIVASHFDDLGPIEVSVPQDTEYEYLHLTRGGGRRIMMHNPMYAPGTPYEELVRRIQALLPDASQE